jgi:hypothetical protein
MAVSLTPVPIGNTTQALNVIAQNFQLLQAAFNQYLAQTNPIANPQAAQGLVIPGKVTSYGGATTSGNGVPAVVAYARQINIRTNISAATPLLSYVVGPQDQSLLVTAAVTVLSGTNYGFEVAANYYTDAGAPWTSVCEFMWLGPNLETSLTSNLYGDGIGAYNGLPMHLRCKAGTTVVIYAAGNFTTVTYNIEAAIIQIA